MSRETREALRRPERSALVAYLTAGYPDRDTSLAALLADLEPACIRTAVAGASRV